MKILNRSAVIGVFILGCLSFKVLANEDAERKAVESATIWLKLVDEGKYGGSWETAAAYFKNSVSKQQWVQMLTAVRKPLGRIVSRDLKSKNYMESLPGAPDGQYVVVQFTSMFENKKSAIETVTPMLDPDGKWKVSGYYIQ